MKKVAITFLSLVVLLAVTIIWAIASFYMEAPTDKTVTLVFPPNTHFTTIVDTLAANHVVNHPLLFEILMYANGGAGRVKAGEYDFPARITASEVAGLLESGKTVIHHLTVPEGLMTSEVLKMIRDNDLLTGEITYDVKEGDLLPETYNFSRGDKRNDIILRMHHAMEKTLADAWAGRDITLPLTTPEQALTLASIVEKETGLATERQHVASVYINRLHKNMLLQADPTAAYAVTRGKYKLDRPLTHEDLAMESPYNTYKVAGLPPGPIANPGKACILATLHPVQSDDLYFVATGIGGHNFAKTVAEHNENVRRYLANRQARKGDGSE